jgi:Fe-S cluster biogenesis protein NfuA
MSLLGKVEYYNTENGTVWIQFEGAIESRPLQKETLQKVKVPLQFL